MCNEGKGDWGRRPRDWATARGFQFKTQAQLGCPSSPATFCLWSSARGVLLLAAMTTGLLAQPGAYRLTNRSAAIAHRRARIMSRSRRWTLVQHVHAPAANGAAAAATAHASASPPKPAAARAAASTATAMDCGGDDGAAPDVAINRVELSVPHPTKSAFSSAAPSSRPSAFAAAHLVLRNSDSKPKNVQLMLRPYNLMVG